LFLGLFLRDWKEGARGDQLQVLEEFTAYTLELASVMLFGSN